MTRSCLAIGFWMRVGVAAGVVASFRPAHAADRLISVTGVGKATAKPSVVELEGNIKGDAELAGDAVVKYNGNRRRAMEAIDALAIKGLSIHGGGISIKSEIEGSQQAAMMGNAAVGNAKLAVSEPLVIRIEGIDQLSTEELVQTLVRIVDAGKDAGFVVGARQPTIWEMQMGLASNKTLATFKLANALDVRHKAYEAAVEDARQHAQELAELAGVKLGPIASISENAPADKDKDSTPRDYYGMMYSLMNADRAKGGYSSPELKEIEVSVALRVEFAIEPSVAVGMK